MVIRKPPRNQLKANKLGNGMAGNQQVFMGGLSFRGTSQHVCFPVGFPLACLFFEGPPLCGFNGKPTGTPKQFRGFPQKTQTHMGRTERNARNQVEPAPKLANGLGAHSVCLLRCLEQGQPKDQFTIAAAQLLTGQHPQTSLKDYGWNLQLCPTMGGRPTL